MDGWIPEAEGKGTHGYMMALTDFGVKLLFCYHVREGYHIRLPTHVWHWPEPRPPRSGAAMLGGVSGGDLNFVPVQSRAACEVPSPQLLPADVVGQAGQRDHPGQECCGRTPCPSGRPARVWRQQPLECQGWLVAEPLGSPHEPKLIVGRGPCTGDRLAKPYEHRCHPRILTNTTAATSHHAGPVRER